MSISEIIDALTAEQREEFSVQFEMLRGIEGELLAQPDLELSKTQFRTISYFYEKLPRVRLLQAALLLARIARETEGSEPATATLCGLIQLLLRRSMGLDVAQLSELLEFVAEFEALDLKVVPLLGVVSEIERTRLEGGLPAAWKEQLTAIAVRLNPTGAKPKGPTATVLAKIEKLCDHSILPRIVADEGWAEAMSADIQAMPAESRRKWDTLLHHASSIVPQHPAPKWDVMPDEAGWVYEDPTYDRRQSGMVLDRRCSTSWRETLRRLIGEIGADEYWKCVFRWLDLVPHSKTGHVVRECINREVLRGLLWSMTDCPLPSVETTLGAAADYFYKNSSPLAPACVIILAFRGQAGAMLPLSRLATRVRAGSQSMLVEVARERVAAKCGTAIEDLEDLSIPTSGFTELGRRRDVFSGFAAEITLDGQSASLKWFKPNGQPQGSVPAAVKRDHADELADLKRAVKEVETTVATLANRFESAPVGQRSWSVGEWRTQYFDHPVAGTNVRRLLWELREGDAAQVAGCGESGFVDAAGRSVKVGDDARIAVWHPAGATVETVKAWRLWLEERQITQPFKQAHREIYLLTDAERTTGVYSNRFASHILRQSQFRALSKARGWKSDFLGGWDGGDSGKATRALPRWRLQAEFWIGAAGFEHTEQGSTSFIATDQVRFLRTDDAKEPVPLSEVPSLAFSEVMRDVDLFVGVCSVGNNPLWHDGGPEQQFRDYWHDFSFGELTESAATRKGVLERLVPRLKIADRCRFDGRFLCVRGDLRTYKIHLGSGNILMEPNDQYLCIVPDGRSRSSRADVYLPFEGDNTLSVIISKALLLAEDAAITDPTIVSQIRRQ